jgi:hypothetical protein
LIVVLAKSNLNLLELIQVIGSLKVTNGNGDV